MMAESPTGRGYNQGSDSYNPADVARMEREDRQALEKKRLNQLSACANQRRPPGCTCWDSDFGMDVDRCPVHGKGCA